MFVKCVGQFHTFSNFICTSNYSVQTAAFCQLLLNKLCYVDNDLILDFVTYVCFSFILPSCAFLCYR